MNQIMEIAERLKGALAMPDVEMVASLEGLLGELEAEIEEYDRAMCAREEELRLAEELATDQQCYSLAGIPW